MKYTKMKATIKGKDLNFKPFTQELEFELVPPKKGTSYYGTGCYMVVKFGERPIDHELIDVRYERTTDIEILADRWIKGYYGMNAQEVIKEFAEQ